MIWTVAEEQLYDENVRKHAGGKAREDLSRIFTDCGYSEITISLPQRERESATNVKKFLYHLEAATTWKKALRDIKTGDSLILQFPVINHTLLFNNVLKKLKNRGVEVYAFIHDLEILRMGNDARFTRVMRWRMKKEEVDELNLFDGIVVHNEKMKKLLAEKLNVDEGKMFTLGIFDYLTTDDFSPSMEVENFRNCIIAGNLNSNKSKYIYELPETPDFELYGVNFETSDNPAIHYHGSFLADDLPFHMKGGFGLVWDGDSAKTCNGAWGAYLRFNNPHKTSLYLACGIPVVIWDEAALADYILTNKVGIVVKSTYDIDKALSDISEEQYREMKKNAIEISSGLRNGSNTIRVLRKMGLR